MRVYLDWSPTNPREPTELDPLFERDALAVVKVADRKYDVCHVPTGARTGVHSTNARTAKLYAEWMLSKCNWNFSDVSGKAGAKAYKVWTALRTATNTWTKCLTRQQLEGVTL